MSSLSPLQIIKSLNLGQLLLIETHKELLVGTLKFVNPMNYMIELENVRDLKTNFTYQTSQSLGYELMKSIKLIKDNDTENLTEDTTSTDDDDDDDSEELLINFKSLKTSPLVSSSCRTTTTTTSSSTNYAIKPVKQSHSIGSSSKEQCDGLISVQLTTLDFQLLQAQLDSMVYITQTDQKYHKALADIRSQTIIGLIIDPVQSARHRRTSLIAISTPKTVYIFDILSLGKVFKEFRLLLESERPRKAVHYSHRIVDHFKYRHDVELSGVFDTFVAYCVVSDEKCNKSLEEIVQNVFNISDIYFEPEFEENRSLNPYNRPLSQDYRLVIAKKVAFQLKLCDQLLHEQMLKNFYQQCYKFSQTLSHNEDGFAVAQQMHPTSNAGHEYIQPNGNWNDKLEPDLEFATNNELERR